MIKPRKAVYFCNKIFVSTILEAQCTIEVLKMSLQFFHSTHISLHVIVIP